MEKSNNIKGYMLAILGGVSWGMLIGGSVFFVLIRAWIFPENLDFPAWAIIAVIVIIGTAVGFSVFLSVSSNE